PLIRSIWLPRGVGAAFFIRGFELWISLCVGRLPNFWNIRPKNHPAIGLDGIGRKALDRTLVLRGIRSGFAPLPRRGSTFPIPSIRAGSGRRCRTDGPPRRGLGGLLLSSNGLRP